jgi:rhamnose transport system ATP-binding protein
VALLEVSGISKAFAGTRALSNVSFRLNAGEVTGLIGENGAGKSTLIKILAGVHQPDSGAILWQGTATQFRNPHAALTAGLATIHQELAYFEKLTVAENLLLGERWPRRSWGGVNWRRLNEITAERLKGCELDIDPQWLFQTLSSAQRQEIAIARALSKKARLVILDEPSASLTEPEVERLMAHLGRLKKSGVAILYVSHRLDEILKLSDRVIVLRDGNLAAEYPKSEASIERMVRDMVGRELASLPRRQPGPYGSIVFSARGLSRPPLFESISFDVRAGEILGLSGLIGAGRSEFARAAYGLYSPTSGAMQIAGQAYTPQNASDARRNGVAYLPEERKRQGFVLSHSLQSSISIGLLDCLSRLGWIFGRREEKRVAEAIARFQIKARAQGQPVGTLSGGNQQKALLARWLETDPRFIILDEPTRGVDVGAKVEIHRLISNLASQGKAILLISSDLPELLALSDRVVVLHRGKSTAEFTAEEASQEKILLAASGFAIESAISE